MDDIDKDILNALDITNDEYSRIMAEECLAKTWLESQVKVLDVLRKYCREYIEEFIKNKFPELNGKIIMKDINLRDNEGYRNILRDLEDKNE